MRHVRFRLTPCAGGMRIGNGSHGSRPTRRIGAMGIEARIPASKSLSRVADNDSEAMADRVGRGPPRPRRDRIGARHATGHDDKLGVRACWEMAEHDSEERLARPSER